MIQCTRCRHLTPTDARGLQYSICPKCGAREYLDIHSRPYRPSNSTEGECFQSKFCNNCWKNRNQGCLIPHRTTLFHENDPKYPKEWTYDDIGRPICTAFLSFEEHAEQVKAMYHPRPRVPENQMRLL